MLEMIQKISNPMESSVEVPKKLKLELLDDPEINFWVCTF